MKKTFHPSDESFNLKDIQRHRNGVSGEGFYVVTFKWSSLDGEDTIEKWVIRNMVGVVFEASGHVAVFEREMLGKGIIEFGVNSWRGDNFEGWLRRQVTNYEIRTSEVIAGDYKVIEALP